MGIREPRGGSGLVTPCKRSRGGARLGVGLSQTQRDLHEADFFVSHIPTALAVGYATTAPHRAGFIGGSALHPINLMPCFLADTNICFIPIKERFLGFVIR